MTDIIWIITSSVLILAVIAVRAVFGKKMSAGLRYALWALVLVRLLIPGTVFSSSVSVESAAESTEVVQNYQAIRGIGSIAYSPDSSVAGYPRSSYYPPAAQTTTAPIVPSVPADNEPASEPITIVNQATPERFERMQKTLRFRDIVVWVWIVGMACALLFFLFQNLRFMFDLRSRRKRIEANCRRPVYSVENLPSSCLFFGSIYISADTAADPDSLRFVLEHEKAHFRHGDHIWTVLRLAALVIHWYNPLVWWAAVLSRRDGELFADAGAISRLGDGCREDYGLTLIALSARRPVTPPIFSAATTMTNGKHELKQRINNIAKKHKRNFVIAAIVLLITAAAVFFTFTGCKTSEKPGPDAPTEKITAEPTEKPTERPTKEPIPVPTFEPTPEPTLVPKPSEEWLLDDAWRYAELLNSSYGLGFTRENIEISMDDDYNVCYAQLRGGGPSLSITYYYNNSRGWYAAFNDFFPSDSFDLSGLDSNWPRLDLLDNAIVVTAEELASGGYIPDGTINDYLAVASLLAQRLTQTYVDAPENSAFRCIEADHGEPYVYAMPLMPDGAFSIDTALYFRPVHYNEFLYCALEVYPSLAGPDEIHPGWIRFGLSLCTSIKTTANGWRCNIGFPSDGGIAPGFIYPREDAMSYITFNANRILNPSSDDSLENNASWFIRSLYGMDWEEFGRLYTKGQWNIIADRLISGAVGVEGIRQVYMDKCLMLGCINNVPIEYHAGLATLLNAQQAFDAAAFSEAFATLDAAGQAAVLTIMESDSDPLSTLVTNYTSGYRNYCSTSNMYLESGGIQQPRLEGKTPYVFFNLEDDGLKAYGRMVERCIKTDSGDYEYTYKYDDLLATYPREVGVLANQKLIEYARKYIFYDVPDDANMICEGFIGEDWFCLITLDDTIQDLQVHCIFYNDGGNWIEIPGNNGGLHIEWGDSGYSFPLFGACVVSKNIAFISYYSKFLSDEELGFTRPYVYRTDDGGVTWKRLSIKLPDYFLPSNNGRTCVPLSPFFKGNHGIMLLSGLTDYECAWLESNDRGKSWTFKFDSLLDYPTD